MQNTHWRDSVPVHVLWEEIYQKRAFDVSHKVRLRSSIVVVMHARTHAYAHTSCRVEISIGTKTSTILVRKNNWENYNQMLSYLLSRKSKFKILPPTVLARNLWQLPPITSNPPFWHTHTQNSKLTPVSIGSPVWLEYFPGFFSRGGLPKVRRCKIPFGKIRHMICGGNEKRRLLYNYRYQCIILQGISLSLFLPVYCFGFLLVNDLRVVLCALKFRLRNFTNPNCSTTRTSSRGVAI